VQFMTAKIRLLARPPVFDQVTLQNESRLRAGGRLRPLSQWPNVKSTRLMWAGDCYRYGLAPDLTLSRGSAVRRNCGARPVVGRPVAIVALFGNYGLTLEPALDRAVPVYTAFAT
jgi:hypothetical protein